MSPATVTRASRGGGRGAVLALAIVVVALAHMPTPEGERG